MFLCFKKYGVSEPYNFNDNSAAEDALLPLDPIPKETARCLRTGPLFEAGKMFPWLAESLLLFTSLADFEGLFSKVKAEEIKINWAMRSDSRYSPHLESLAHDNCQLIVKERPGRLRFLSKFFTVAKKDRKHSRAIFNGRNLSRLQSPPPPVNLPGIPEVLLEAARIHQYWQKDANRVIAPSVHTADIRHYFHEFDIQSDIALYFGVSCAGQEYAWRGLPMGWAHSPRIAQTVSWSLVLTKAPPCLRVEVNRAAVSSHPPAFVCTRNLQHEVTGILFIWYDNFVFICYDNSDFRAVVANINTNRKACGIQWSTESIYLSSDLKRPLFLDEPSKYPVFLGVQLRVDVERRPRDDLPRSRLVWQVEISFRDKCSSTAAVLKDKTITPSRRWVARGIGLVIWRTYVYGIPLINQDDVIAVARLNAPARPGKGQWDAASTVDLQFIQILADRLQSFAADISWNHHDDIAFDTRQMIRVVSDASGSRGAYVSFDGSYKELDQDYWVFDQDSSFNSIFLKELLAATIAIERCHKPLTPLHIAVDNSAAAFVIKRGLSTNEIANDFLRRIFKKIDPALLRVTLIRSGDNAADPLTRDKPLCPKRNVSSIERMLDAERGWPKTEPIVKKYASIDDEDGESDSDQLVLRHRESNESDALASFGGANFDSEDEVGADDIVHVSRKKVAFPRTKRSCK